MYAACAQEYYRHPKLPFVFWRLADFRALVVYPWFCCGKASIRGAGGRRVLSSDTVWSACIPLLSFRHSHVCPAGSCTLRWGSCCVFVFLLIWKPSWWSHRPFVHGKMKQLILSGYVGELILNVRTCLGSQMIFGSVSLIMEFLQLVVFCAASLQWAACNFSARKQKFSE